MLGEEFLEDEDCSWPKKSCRFHVDLDEGLGEKEPWGVEPRSDRYEKFATLSWRR